MVSIWNRAVASKAVSLREPVTYILCILIFWGALVISVFSARLTSTIYENPRVAYTFDSDGPREVLRLENSVTSGNPFPEDSFFYGNAHNLFGFLLSRPIFSAGWNLDFTEYALVMLSIQVVSFVAILFFSFKIAREFLGKLLSIAFAISAATSPVVLFWTSHIHPDIVQQALITASVYFFVREDRQTIISFAILGLATGTKYFAIIYLVFLVGGLLWGKWLPGIKSGNWRNLAPPALAFFVSFIVTNVSLVTQFDQFLAHTWYSVRAVASGFSERGDPNPALWLPIFWQQAGPFFVLIALGLGYLSGRWLKTRQSIGFSREKQFLILSVVTLSLGVAHLAIGFTYRPPRYLMHLLPIILLLTALIVSEVLSKLSRRKREVLALLATSILVVPAALNLSSFLGDLKSEIESIKNDERIAVGKSLISHCDSKISVLAPMYSYAPPEFRNVIGWRAYEISEEDLLNSDLILLNSSIPGRFVWPDQNGGLTLGQAFGSEAQFELLSREVFQGGRFEKLYSSPNYIVMMKTDSDLCSPFSPPPIEGD